MMSRIGMPPLLRMRLGVAAWSLPHPPLHPNARPAERVSRAGSTVGPAAGPSAVTTGRTGGGGTSGWDVGAASRMVCVYWVLALPFLLSRLGVIGIGRTDAQAERGGGQKHNLHSLTPVQRQGKRMTEL